MHPVIAERMDEIAGICRRHRVSLLELFGSAARGTDFDPETSDADFLVEFEPPEMPGLFRRYMGLIRDLQAVLGREVDMLSIDNEYLLEAINESREVVYDPKACSADTASRYRDGDQPDRGLYRRCGACDLRR